MSVKPIQTADTPCAFQTPSSNDRFYGIRYMDEKGVYFPNVQIAIYRNGKIENVRQNCFAPNGLVQFDMTSDLNGEIQELDETRCKIRVLTKLADEQAKKLQEKLEPYFAKVPSSRDPD